MLIVDAQLHEPSVWLDWSDADGAARNRLLVEVQLAYMTAVGVDATVIFPLSHAWAESSQRDFTSSTSTAVPRRDRRFAFGGHAMTI